MPEVVNPKIKQTNYLYSIVTNLSWIIIITVEASLLVGVDLIVRTIRYAHVVLFHYQINMNLHKSHNENIS